MPSEQARAEKKKKELLKKLADKHLEVGISAYYAENYEQALVSFSEYLKFYPRAYKKICNRGLTYAALNNWDAAKKDAQTVIELKPDYISGHMLLFNSYSAQRNYSGIIKAATAIIDLTSISPIEDIDSEMAKDIAKVYYMRAATQIELTDIYTHDIGRDLASAIKIDPEYAPAYLHYGNYLRLTGDLISAREAFMQGMLYDPNLPFELALTFLKEAEEGRALPGTKQLTEEWLSEGVILAPEQPLPQPAIPPAPSIKSLTTALPISPVTSDNNNLLTGGLALLVVGASILFAYRKSRPTAKKADTKAESKNSDTRDIVSSRANIANKH